LDFPQARGVDHFHGGSLGKPSLEGMLDSFTQRKSVTVNLAV
jgi:hypothetical protein